MKPDWESMLLSKGCNPKAIQIMKEVLGDIYSRNTNEKPVPLQQATLKWLHRLNYAWGRNDDLVFDRVKYRMPKRLARIIMVSGVPSEPFFPWSGELKPTHP